MNRRNFITRALAFLGGCVGLGSYTKAGLHFEYDWANSVFMGQPKPNGNLLRETVEAPSSFMHVFRSLPMPCGHRAWRPVEQDCAGFIHPFHEEWGELHRAATRMRCLECGTQHKFVCFGGNPNLVNSEFYTSPLVWKAEAQS